MRFSAVLGALSVLFVMATGSAAAAPVMGVPVDGEMGFQAAATPVMENITWFHNMLLIIITVISLLVLGLLVWVICVTMPRPIRPLPSSAITRWSRWYGPQRRS